MKSNKFLILCLIGFSTMLPSYSSSILTDVPDNYWAKKYIENSIQQNYFNLSSDKFNPDLPITRQEFANAIYNIIERNLPVDENIFTDVNNDTKYGKSISGLNKLKIMFGYPDKSFKPEQNLKRSEASSVVANVIRSEVWKLDVLDNFKDKNEIPNWAKDSYVNNIINRIYVNYPHADELAPEKELTRAEAAVLVVKLNEAVENYKALFMASNNSQIKEEIEEQEELKAVPVLKNTHTLEEMKNSYETKVEIYDTKKVILAGNIIPIKAVKKVDFSKVKKGDVITYRSLGDIYSTQGEKLYSKDTTFKGIIQKTGKSLIFKKQNKAYLIFNEAILSNKNKIPIAGVLYTTEKGKVVKGKNKNSKKVQKDLTKQYSKELAGIKFKNKLTPLVKYRDNAKDNVFMLLTADMIIPSDTGL